MEGDEGLRTIECLRGRLLAERQASRIANQNAELMDKKLIELEKQLTEEIKSREKAEKKLRLLMNKLKSLKGSLKSEESVQSEHTSSSETSAMSCVSSASASDPKEQEEQKRESQITNAETSQDSEHGIAKKQANQDFQENASMEGNSSPQEANSTNLRKS